MAQLSGSAYRLADQAATHAKAAASYFANAQDEAARDRGNYEVAQALLHLSVAIQKIARDLPDS